MGAAWSGVLPYAGVLAVVVALIRTRDLREREPGLALRQRLGIVLLAAPLFTLLGVGIVSLPTLAGAGTSQAASPDALTSKALLHLGLYLALPFLGVALVLGRDLPARARRALAPPGREGLARSLRICGVLSATLSGGVLVAWSVAGGHGRLLAGDGASLFFSRTTPLVALALSLVAALAEELMFRGILLWDLGRRMPGQVAIGGQALAFGLIHAGYGSAIHVLAALAFGVIMGVVALRVGLLPAIGTHLLVNVVILSLWSGHRVLLVPAVLVLVGAFAGARLLEGRGSSLGGWRPGARGAGG